MDQTDKIRSCFPILNQKVYNKTLIYFDSAASTLKPFQVFEAEKRLFEEYYGNIHRASHYMSDKATVDFENVRDKVKQFINANSREEIIFTKSTTEGINLVAFSFCEKFLNQGDEVVISEMEHHSNMVPWQMAAVRKGATIKMLPFSEAGEIQVDKLDKLITGRTKIMAIAHVSNTLGTVNPVNQIIEIAHKHNVSVLIDGAQAIQHMPVDVQEMDADFYVFSAHKAYGPNGVGVLYGKKALLEEIPPYQGGGEMISEVSFNGTTYNELPYKFEAGTPNITGVIGFGAAIDFLNQIGMDQIYVKEQQILKYASSRLKEVKGIRIYGESSEKSGVISFNMDGIHPYDVGQLLDKLGIAVRTGHLCADPVMQHFNVPGMVRISFGIYSTIDEVDALIEALNKVKIMFG